MGPAPNVVNSLTTKEDERLINAENLVMIQCVGCRNEDRNYCSRICCSESIKNALKLKELNPEMDIYILFRDMRTYGFKEDYYREAAGKGVRFIRYAPDEPPQVESGESDEGRPVLKVTVTDLILGKRLELDADLITLAAAVIPSSATKEVAELFKVTLSPDGFFKEAHVKLRPVEFGTDGVYLCGLAHYPKLIPETINQAYGAAGRILTLLSRDTVIASGSVCEVDVKKCMGCGACEKCRACMTCARRCPAEAIISAKNQIHVIDQEKCIKCGTCFEACPTKFGAVTKISGEPVPSPVPEGERTIVRKKKEVI